MTLRKRLQVQIERIEALRRIPARAFDFGAMQPWLIARDIGDEDRRQPALDPLSPLGIHLVQPSIRPS